MNKPGLSFFVVLTLLWSLAHLSGGPPAKKAGQGSDKEDVSKLCGRVFGDFEGLGTRGFMIFSKLKNPHFSRFFTSSLLAEFSAAEEKLEELRKIKEEVPRKLPFPEGGVLSGLYDPVRDWKLESVSRSASVINAKVAIFIEEEEKPASTLIVSLHEEGGTLKIDEITCPEMGGSVRDTLKDVFR